MSWVHHILREISQQLGREDPNTVALHPCGKDVPEKLRVAAEELADPSNAPTRCLELEDLAQLAYTRMSSAPKSETLCWRRLYTDASLIRSLADLRQHEVQTVATETSIELAERCIERLDHIIIIAGASGEGRLDLIHNVIGKVQHDYLSSSSASIPSLPCANASNKSTPLRSAGGNIPRFDHPPSFESFVSRHFKAPFILSGYICDWPALNEHPWNSHNYLRSVAGPGRVVPVEIGSDYTSDDWMQEIMRWDSFLDAIDRGSISPDETSVASRQGETSVLYLAQHSLFLQFPTLKEDIIIPDYVYACLPPPADFPRYSPPQNSDQLIINAWFGPSGTISPAHTDPYYNFVSQVVGRKTVWLAPPCCTPSMYPYAPPTPLKIASSSVSPPAILEPHNPAANKQDPSMSNTSRVDVFATAPDADQTSAFPLFWKNTVMHAMWATLEPGDMLFFPPGWWHALRSEDTSFSLSMWF